MLDDIWKVSGSLVASTSSIYGYSEESKKFLSSGLKCTNCNKAIRGAFGGGLLNYYLKDGTKIKNTALLLFQRAAICECTSCGYRWNLYGESNSITSNQLEFLGIEETHRLTEDFGTDNRLIDNSKSTSKTTRKFTVSREWSKTYSVQYENTKSNGTEFNLKFGVSELEFGSIKETSEKTLKTAYSVSEVEKETYTEEVQIEISERKKVNLIFTWKHIWQHGFMKFGYQSKEFDIPFKVAVGVTFDQTQIDE